MKSKIYKIVNNINDKVYVGKTNLSLDKRFSEHLRDAKRYYKEHRPLYAAINKYGEEHFHIELIEECDVTAASEREQYWIGYYEGYAKGYNATIGGDGTLLYDYAFIEAKLREGLSTADICNLVGCCRDTVYHVAKMAGIVLESNNALKQEMKQKSIRVAQYAMDGTYIQTFDSYADAARWLLDNGYISKISGGVRSHIGDVCNGKRKSAYKFVWSKA